MVSTRRYYLPPVQNVILESFQKCGNVRSRNPILARTIGFEADEFLRSKVNLKPLNLFAHRRDFCFAPRKVALELVNVVHTTYFRDEGAFHLLPKM